MMDQSEVDSKLRSFQLSVEEIGRLCHQYKNIIDTTPSLYDYKFSSASDTDWTSREKDSEREAKQWKMHHADDEEFY